MTELSLTRFSKAILLSSRPMSGAMFTENLTAFAGLPTWEGIVCALAVPFCRIVMLRSFYTVFPELTQVPTREPAGPFGSRLVSGADMSLALVYAVCIGFFLIQVLFFAGGAFESSRSS